MTKLAIVTGAGQGIGKAVAKKLSQQGYAIGVLDINAETAKQTAAELVASGNTATAYQVDIANEEDFSKAVDQAVADLGELAVFVNNAGVAFIDSIVDSEPEKIKRLIDVNLLGTFWGIRIAAKHFISQGHGGRIINAASLAGVEASALQSAYSASKFGVRGLTQSASKELAKYQITVNAYNPGVVRTPMRDAIDKRTAAIKSKTIPDQQKDVLSEISLGREATPEDVANVVSFFASPEGSYLTGQSLLVDGGMEYR
ncbi:acetoin reductase [Lentilactobacillus kosonis]|uniref:diacetyl reductase [(S)-acetoin forming] n=1 Tax=Lentilactobacillus kosonis TaxID=2810561 RepID=A0A401FNU4_9LACO|nr:acetoin reductase [Lentilactobacillus kosonis]GAY73938.1 2,3-butanediol dehydrogenase, S-alcohol forming, (R)-acetoin-specific [Lentilactobacillus kosonis]